VADPDELDPCLAERLPQWQVVHPRKAEDDLRSERFQRVHQLPSTTHSHDPDTARSLNDLAIDP
jgi:hypothetical protein